MAKVAVITDINFKTQVLESEMPILVDFWASWCPPCKMVEQTLEELIPILNGSVRIAKINVDQNPAIASEYSITGVPTFILFNSGAVVARRTGAQSTQQLLDMFKEADVYNG